MIRISVILIFLSNICLSQTERLLNTYEQISHSTVKIQCVKPFVDSLGIKKYRKTAGTGFLLEFDFNGQKGIFLVTNKHVIKNATKGELVFTLSKKTSFAPDYGNHTVVKIKNFENQFVLHDDPNVDLCAMNINKIIKEFKEKKINTYLINIPESFIMTESDMHNVTQGDKDLMVGYPRGLIDKKNNAPIFRTGICATAPYLDYNGTKEFLIDMSVLNGSSGSPIFQIQQKSKNSKGRDPMITTIYDDFKLIGIVYASPMYKASISGNSIEITQIGDLADNSKVIQIPMNLGVVIKSQRLFELKNKILKERTKTKE